MKDIIKQLIAFAYGGFDNLVADIVTKVSQKPQSFNSNVYSIMTNLNLAIKPIGYSLLALFFLMDFLSKTTNIENVTWEKVVKCLLKLVLAKMVMENAFWFLDFIFGIVSAAITASGSVTSGIPVNVVNTLNTYIDSLGVLSQLGFFCAVLPFILISLAAKLIVYLIVYGRMIEIYILTAVAPLPIAAMINNDTSSIAKKFFQHYFAVCLQGLVIVIGAKIYGGIIGTIPINGNMWNILFQTSLSSLLFVLILVKSGSWAKQIVGLA